MRYFSMFSGIGGFELGIGELGECVGYSEIDKYAIKVYERHFGNGNNSNQQTATIEQVGKGRNRHTNETGGNVHDRQPATSGHVNYGDATKINASELPDFDLLVGGFPCQAFSVAGKRAGFNDTRGTLFFDIARILKEKQPRHLVLENVKGLLSHDSGRTFSTIIGVLTDLGYSVEWQVLNSKDFGVPQNRERVFIVGHLGNGCRRKVLPLRSTDKVYTRPNQAEEKVHAGTLTARQFTSWNGNYIKQNNQPTHSNDRVYGEDGISPTLNTMQGGARQPFIAPVLTPDRPEKRQNGRRMKDNGEPAFTVTAQDRHGLYDGARIRRLTPVECERLQGFPDQWTAGESDTQRYKMCGNAVTTNVVQAVMEKLYEHTR